MQTRFRVGLILFAAALALPLHAQKVPVIEKQLSNGVRLLLVQRKDEPTVSGGWVAHVGASNEKPGITGIAHLFEHMMFKGTPTIGTKDYRRDLEIINEQEKIRDQMREEEKKMREALRHGELTPAPAEATSTNEFFNESGPGAGKRQKEVKTVIVDPAAALLMPENWTPRYRELQKQFKELVEEQRKVLVPNEFDKVYTSNGGSGMNAYTSEDMTVYFITVPANKLELWMWMESGRLYQPVFREFYAERDVVFEERRMRTESTPLGKFAETFESMFWESHPYQWPVVGWPSDIPAISKAQADEFYGIFYAPQNVTVVLVGDVDTEKTTAMAEKYFGRIPRGKKEAPDVVTLEVKQPAEKRMYAEAETEPQVDILWHTVAFGHKDSYALQVLAQILSTRTGRFYKGLTMGREIATDTWAQPDHRKWAGYFNAGGEAKDGHTPEEVEKAIYEELEKLKTEPIPPEELQKVKNNFAAGEYRKLSSNAPILMQLLHYDGEGDWREINESGPKIQAVTAADVQRVVKQYFTKENRAVAVYTRKPAGKPTVEKTPDKNVEPSKK